jgi:hypothetical protein
MEPFYSAGSVYQLMLPPGAFSLALLPSSYLFIYLFAGLGFELRALSLQSWLSIT